MSALRRGSSLPVIAETPGGTFVVKLRGAGQGTHALIAEIIAAEVAEAIGLPVPDRALIELTADVPSAERHEEVLELLAASAGQNLGLRWLAGARDITAAEAARLDDAFVARLLWMDGLVMNVDRTVQNPNLVSWKGQPWLIDHGAALTFQHDWEHLEEQTPREATDWSRHLFGHRTELLERIDETLAPLVTREVLIHAAAQVPESFLEEVSPGEAPDRLRARYTAFLWKRLKPPRPFVATADASR